MPSIVVYLVLIAASYIWSLSLMLVNSGVDFIEPYRVGILCAIIGGLGGCLYCLRGVYTNYCVRDSWDNKWAIWYILRPIISAGAGAVSFLFLKAGLLVLESNVEPNASEFGFYALAFIAGLNVDCTPSGQVGQIAGYC
jgi:hypothetical protein